MANTQTPDHIVIAHCWEGVPGYAFYPWVKSQLEAKPGGKYRVDIPAMPDTDHPRLAPWVQTLRQAMRPHAPGGRLFVIAHSLGAITTMHCLAADPDLVLDGLVIVAGNLTAVGFETEIGEFFRGPLDISAIVAGQVRRPPQLIYSHDDPWVTFASEAVTMQRLTNGQLHEMDGLGHFSGPLSDPSSCTELPEVVTAIEKLADQN